MKQVTKCPKDFSKRYQEYLNDPVLRSLSMTLVRLFSNTPVAHVKKPDGRVIPTYPPHIQLIITLAKQEVRMYVEENYKDLLEVIDDLELKEVL